MGESKECLFTAEAAKYGVNSESWRSASLLNVFLYFLARSFDEECLAAPYCDSYFPTVY
jgi:hypothetical protein